MLNNDEQSMELLQQKPLVQQKRRKAQFLLLLGGIVILCAFFVVAWQVYTTNNASSNTGPSTGQNEGPTHVPWDDYPDVYWQTLRAHVAQGLHMTEQQIEDNLHATLLANATPDTDIRSADAAKWISDLASAHGVSQEQLHTIEITAVQQAHAVLVNRHVLTQQQADDNMHRMNQDELNLHMVDAFHGGGATNEQGK